MARRRRRARWLVLLVPLFIAASLHTRHQIGWLVLFVTVYAVTTVTLWVLLFMRTTCDMITKTHGRPCGNAVRGRLRGCQYHKREKRAVWLARIGIKGPAAKLGRRVARPATPRPAQAAGGESDDTLTVDKPVTDTFTVICNAVGLVGTVVSTTVGVVGLVLDLS